MLSLVEEYQNTVNSYRELLTKQLEIDQQLDQLEDHLDHLYSQMTKDEIEQIYGKCRYTREDWGDDL